MKIRGDFVTNSSSSSFLTISIENPVMAEIMEKYKENFKELYFNCSVNENDIGIGVDEFGGWSFPESKDEIIIQLLDLFSTKLHDLVAYNEIPDDELNNPNPNDKIFEMAMEIWKRRDEVMDAMGYFFAEEQTDNWGEFTEWSGGEDWEETKTVEYKKEDDFFEYNCENSVEDDWNEDEEDEDWDEDEDEDWDEE